MNSTFPPRLARALMRFVVPADFLELVLGDLEEGFRCRVRTNAKQARRWYWFQLVRSMGVRLTLLREKRGGPKSQTASSRFLVGNTMQNLIRDFRWAVRTLSRSPGFALVVVLTIGLSIGANTAIFSIVDGILLRPLPYPAPERLVTVWADYTRRDGPVREWLSYPNILDLRGEREVFEELGAYGGWRPTLTGLGAAEQLLGTEVTEGMFSRVLSVSPVLGRGFSSEDDRPDGPNVVVLSHGFWTRAFGADPSAVGTTISLSGTSFEIIGVMPPRFSPPFFPDAQLWRPLQLDLATTAGSRGDAVLRSVGRTREGVALDLVRARATALGDRLEAEYPDNAGVGYAIFPLQDDLTRSARPALWVLLGAVSFVLLIACANVVNLLLARMTTRRGEIAVRAALGAGRRRITQQILAESFVLAAVGGLLGVVVAFVATDALSSLAPAGTPRIDEVVVDARVLGFTGVLTVVVGLLVGLVPALRASRADMHDSLKEGGRGFNHGRRSGRLRSTLIAGQVALALTLLVGAALFVKSLERLSSVDPGFETSGKLTVQITLPENRYPNRQATSQFFADLENRVLALPGVERVGSINSLPLSNLDGDADFNVEGQPLPDPGKETVAWVRRITPSYLETMGISLVDGRGFSEADDAEAPRVVIVNQTMAERHFPGESAVGRRINMNRRDEPVWRQIVGVAENVKNFGIRRESPNAVYFPYFQAPTGFMFVVVQTDGNPESLVPMVRDAVAGMDGDLALASVATMESIVQGSLGADRFNTMLLSLFAAIAFALATIGLYGVVSYSVNQRMREMGVRIALGAGGSEIRKIVIGKSLWLVGVGLLLGVVGAAAIGRVVRGLLYDVSPTDPASFVGAGLALILTALVASAIPARRATRADPIAVLRSE